MQAGLRSAFRPACAQVEALAQLGCLDALSAPLAIRLAVGTARKLEEGQRLAVGQLSQLARIMQSLSIAAGKRGRGPGGRRIHPCWHRRLGTASHRQGATSNRAPRPSFAAATTSVEPATLLAATATWHLLVVRAESLAQEQAAAPASQGDAPAGAGCCPLGLALSRMWTASRLLMALIRAGAPPSFTLPDRLG